ncbi:hypothetical protein LQV05_000274 [Cryptococcus neoformans]|nr:hypothetical protein C356_00307 [Cryptococcus neoformans var. grubii c45]OXB39881.1 hypothetical protein J007_00303 [Cryptococcus neoformans var. grubii]OXC66314.1 hypothetical protein C358_00299 [Cryptococcus neoformans var. grubii MW-RSA852]UOH79279.1 hypothetical protein LQV05_000274 [Cryptococcus neoformans]
MDPRLAFLRLTADNASSLPISCSFQNRKPGAVGHVELNYWPPRRNRASKAPDHLLLFILGNPGLLGYYPHFLSHLHSLLPPSHAILATSHIGHSTRIPGPTIPLPLSQQVASKIELVEAIRGYLDDWALKEGQNRPKFGLMGHSVGAYMACEVMKELNTEKACPVYAGYLLFPTLGWIANTWNGWTLWPIFHRPIKPMLPYLSPLLRPLFSLVNLPETSQSLLLSPSVLKDVLSLSSDEMRQIKAVDTDWFRTQGTDQAEERGLFGVWTGGNGDGWVGKDGPLVQECLGGESSERVKVLDGVPHAFCLTKEHSELVAKIVAGWICPKEFRPETPLMPAEQPQQPLGSNVAPM